MAVSEQTAIMLSGSEASRFSVTLWIWNRLAESQNRSPTAL